MDEKKIVANIVRESKLLTGGKGYDLANRLLMHTNGYAKALTALAENAEHEDKLFDDKNMANIAKEIRKIMPKVRKLEDSRDEP